MQLLKTDKNVSSYIWPNDVQYFLEIRNISTEWNFFVLCLYQNSLKLAILC